MCSTEAHSGLEELTQGGQEASGRGTVGDAGEGLAQAKGQKPKGAWLVGNGPTSGRLD